MAIRTEGRSLVHRHVDRSAQRLVAEKMAEEKKIGWCGDGWCGEGCKDCWREKPIAKRLGRLLARIARAFQGWRRRKRALKWVRDNPKDSPKLLDPYRGPPPHDTFAPPASDFRRQLAEAEKVWEADLDLESKVAQARAQGWREGVLWAVARLRSATAPPATTRGQHFLEDAEVMAKWLEEWAVGGPTTLLGRPNPPEPTQVPGPGRKVLG